MIDLDGLYGEADQIRWHLCDVARVLEGARNHDVGITTAVITLNCNAAENALEAALASVRKAKSEARLITYQREQYNAAFDLSQRLPSPRPSVGLPAVGSFAAE